MPNPYQPPRSRVWSEDPAPPSFARALDAAVGAVNGPFLLLILPVATLDHFLIAVEAPLPVELALFVVSGFLIAPLQACLCIASARAARRGTAAAPGPLLRSAIGAWPRVTIALLLPTLLIFVGFVLLIVPGIVLMVRYAFVDAMAFEGEAEPADCGKASAAIARGRAGLVTAVLLAFLAPSIALSGVSPFLSELDGFPLETLVPVFDVSCAVWLTLSSSACWAIYVDLRGDPRP